MPQETATNEVSVPSTEAERHAIRARAGRVRETLKDDAAFVERARTQRVLPYLYYEDGIAAMEFLTQTFGLVERRRRVREDGTLFHGELVWDGDVIFLGSPTTTSEAPEAITNMYRDASMFCVCDDPDALYERVVTAGARIQSEPCELEWGRMFVALDTEGRSWFFSQLKPGY